MKKSFLYPIVEGILLILPPLLISAVLAVLYLTLDSLAAPVFGVLIWVTWFISVLFTMIRKSAGGALGLGILLFCSCGFYGLSLAADYEMFFFPAVVRALFTLFGAPYSLTTAGIRSFLPEEGAAAILACTGYLLLVIVSSAYAAIRFGKKTKRK